eukprot:364759-Chlamydomonas_euryale.AAC.29
MQRRACPGMSMPVLATHTRMRRWRDARHAACLHALMHGFRGAFVRACARLCWARMHACMRRWRDARHAASLHALKLGCRYARAQA